MLKSMLINLAKELVFEALLTVLRQEAKKSHTPFDDGLVDYLAQAKPELLAALNKAF